jgi:hypothetical protein
MRIVVKLGSGSARTLKMFTSFSSMSILLLKTWLFQYASVSVAINTYDITWYSDDVYSKRRVTCH